MSASIDTVTILCLPDDVLNFICSALLGKCTISAFNFVRSTSIINTILKPRILIPLLEEASIRLNLEAIDACNLLAAADVEADAEKVGAAAEIAAGIAEELEAKIAAATATNTPREEDVVRLKDLLNV